jgi:hypothetical protein
MERGGARGHGGAGSTPRSAVSAAATLCQCRSPNGPFEVVRQGLFECVSRDDQGELFVGTFMDEAKLRQYLCPHGSARCVLSLPPPFPLPLPFPLVPSSLLAAASSSRVSGRECTKSVRPVGAKHLKCVESSKLLRGSCGQTGSCCYTLNQLLKRVRVVACPSVSGIAHV